MQKKILMVNRNKSVTMKQASEIGKSQSSRIKSVKSTTSQTSNVSVGISASKGQCANQSATIANQLRFRLMPEGSGNNMMNIYDHHVFDCVVFVIFCEKHRTFALTNVAERNRMFSWFPFVLLHDVFTWNRISRDGLSIILGQSDAEMDPTMAALPEYSVSWLNILRIQVPKSKKFYTRITQFVKLNEGSDEVKCCQTTNRIRWVKMTDILSGTVSNAWGEEVTMMVKSLSNEERVFLHECTLDSCFPYTNDSPEGELLQQVNYNTAQIQEIYNDYVSHLYPAFCMTFNSFRCFLLKFQLVAMTDKQMNRLFQSAVTGENVAPETKPYMTFEMFLLTLACMDPKANSKCNLRMQFIFRSVLQ